MHYAGQRCCRYEGELWCPTGGPPLNDWVEMRVFPTILAVLPEEEGTVSGSTSQAPSEELQFIQIGVGPAYRADCIRPTDRRGRKRSPAMD